MGLILLSICDPGLQNDYHAVCMYQASIFFINILQLDISNKKMMKMMETMKMKINKKKNTLWEASLLVTNWNLTRRISC